MEIDFSDFKKVDIRIGRVVSAERVEGSDKLLKFSVSFGDNKKQAVAGLGHLYRPEDFVGKQYAFVVNLKPRKIRSAVSECMILAAVDEKEVVPLTPEHAITDGSPVR